MGTQGDYYPKWRIVHRFLAMTSFAEKHCGSCLTLLLIVDTLLISKLLTSFLLIFSGFRLYICYLGEFVKNKTRRFPRMTPSLKESIRNTETNAIKESQIQ